MTTYAEAWHNAPNNIQQFYRNLFRRYRQQIGTDFLGLNDQMPMHFYLFSRSHNVALGLPEHQPYWVPGEQIDSIIWSIWPWSPVGLSYPYEPPIADQWSLIHFPAAGYPRDKYNARRTYWTGKPGHRRNI